MLLFCPICSNSLTISRSQPDAEFPDGRHRMECRTCTYNYVFDPQETLYEQKAMKAKEVEDVMGGTGAWDNVEQAATQCTREGCDGTHAFFFQKQIRSADEPMTTFYMCTTCAHRWREN